MDVNDAHFIEVSDSSQLGEAARRVKLIATEIGLDQKAIDRVAVICAELTTNILKHGKGGFLIAQGLIFDDNVALELFALDKGPGMTNIKDCMEDGFTTVGTLGTGLGAIARMSDTIEIGSNSRGTVLQSRVWLNKPAPVDPGIVGFSVPIKGEVLSGDKWKVCKTDNGFYCLLVDGLGHGFEAAEAAKLAVERFKENLSLSPSLMISVLHKALRGSRGAVGAVAKIDVGRQELTYAGLGNIGGILVTNGMHKHLTSLNGTLGYESRNITEFKQPWNPLSTLVMHSDGLSSKVSEELTGIDCNITSAGIIAASIFLHQAKRSDDATILVAKETR
jgi:anti-sigma regulatory factor (Ser/Thr protein kinase)